MAYIDQPEMETEALLSVLKGPDFPTGGIIANKSELPAIHETGMGRIKLRARMEVELGKRRSTGQADNHGDSVHDDRRGHQ